MSRPPVSDPSRTGASPFGASGAGTGASGAAAVVSVGDDELLTGEAVALDVRPTGFLLRSAGGAIDWLTFTVPMLAVFVWYGQVLPTLPIDQALATALVTATTVFFWVIAPIVVEVLTRGRSLGRLAVGSRIVRDDGGAAGVRHAIIRGLLGYVEIFVSFGSIAFIVSLLNRRSKRLGDLIAGTYSQNERVPRPMPHGYAMPPELFPWAQIADVAKLPDRLSRRIAAHLASAPRADPAIRARLSFELAAEASRFVSPLPDVDPFVFLIGVAVMRRDRDYTALLGERRRLERLQPALRGLPHGFPDR
ncbi:RDD family protein [Cnuibacter sp. UC19_7]|uniref:RDD family protein n=1 Tax=Cnuibacter sp. UC19_7 TaxID=3350166 RepID=UPI00366B0CED